MTTQIAPLAANDGTDDDGYDANANAFGCYAAAIRACRLNGIREGRFGPNPNDPEEVEATRVAGVVSVQPYAHRESA